MNGQSPSPLADKVDIMLNDDHIKYGEKKKMSLTLPLLNITNPASQDDDDDDDVVDNDNIAKATNDAEQSETIVDESNTKKKIYEADDTFIQAIFSQTIKSTTATPTDDEPSHSFDVLVANDDKIASNVTPTKEPSSDNVDDDAIEETIDEPIDIPNMDTQPKIAVNVEEPAAVYTYFHQTIEEDDSPDLEMSSCKNDTSNPINTLTTRISSQCDQSQSTNICIQFKDDSSEIHHQSFDNSLNNKSTASASNEAISELEHSLNQLNSFDSDVSVLSSQTHIFIYTHKHRLTHKLKHIYRHTESA